MLSRVEVAALHRFYDPLVRRLLRATTLQRADQENVAQVVWLNVIRLWPANAPDNAAAYITDITRNAVKALYRQQRRKKCDVRRTTQLDIRDSAQHLDPAFVHDDDTDAKVSRSFLRRRIIALAQKCGGEIAEIVHRLLAEAGSVSEAERRRAIGALRRALHVRARKLGETPQPYLVEPESQCGRAVRDIDDEDAAA